MQLTQPASTGSGHPSVSFTEMGQGVQLAVAKVDRVQSRDYDTGEPKTYSDGNPMMETKVTGIVVAGNAQVLVKNDAGEVVYGPDGKKQYRPVAPGETVCTYYKGQVEKAYNAVKGQLTSVGMLLGDTHDSVQPPKNPQHNPTKLHSFSVAPNPDPASIAAAEALAAGEAQQAAAPLAQPSGDPFPATAATQEAAF